MAYANLKVLLQKHDTAFVAKKGKKYICVRSNELRLTTVQTEAVAFATSKELTHFLECAAIDDRNAEVLGNSVGVYPVYANRAAADRAARRN